MPLLLPAAMLVAGTVCGITVWWIYFAATATACCIIFAFTRYKLVAFAMALGILGAVNAKVRIQTEAPAQYSGKTNHYKADILQTRIGDTSQTLTLRVTDASVDSLHLSRIEPFYATATVPSFDTEYECMHTIKFAATFQDTVPEHDIPDEITAGDIQRQRGIYMHCVLPDDSIKSISPTPGVIPALLRERSKATALLLNSSLKPRTKEFLCTAMLGDATTISRDVRQDFASAGLAHILALSGLHVGLIVMLVSFALWPLKMAGGNVARTIIVILLLWLYAVFTGLGASVVRAVVMLSVYLGARILQRQSSGYNSLCFALIVLILADPVSLFTIGFQLSFAAVVAILLFANALNPVNMRHRLAYNAMGLVCVSLSAIIGTALISCIYFHNMPVYFLLANVATSVLLPWLIGAGALLLLLEWAGWDAVWLCGIIDYIYGTVEWVARWVASLPYATLRHIYLPAWTLIPYAGVVTLLKIWLEKRNVLWGSIFIGSVCVLTAYTCLWTRSTDSSTLYVARTTYHTDIIANIAGEQPVLITTATSADRGAAIYRANQRYTHFLGKRGYDSLYCVKDSFRHRMLEWRRPWLRTKYASIAVISHDSLPAPPPAHINYALVCRGYRKSIRNLTDLIHPDSIVLSYDLHPKRAMRYAAECDSMKIPYRNMRCDGPWNLPMATD